MRSALVLLAALAPAVPQEDGGEPAPAEERTLTFQQQVNLAIEKGATWLKEGELAGREAWGGRVGVTSLVIYAMVKSGVPPRHDAVVRALERIEGATPQHTYDSACLLLALAALGSDEHHEWMQRHVDALVRWQSGGIWGYPAGTGDLSNTQYGALGLWAAARAGARVDDDVWLRLGDGVLDYQARDGGFGYSGRGHSTGSMTAAGVGCLAIAIDRLSSAGVLDRDVHEHWQAGIDQGLEWLGREFTVIENPRGGNWHLYYLYGLERVGALAGVAVIGGHDWYTEGAEVLIAAQSDDGSWKVGTQAPLVSTCFALLFLRRATLPKSGRLMARSRDLYGRDDLALDVSLRASGDSPLSIWISRFGRDSLESHRWPGDEGEGLRVLRVEYLVDGAVVATLEADAAVPSGSERFAHKHEFPRRGDYRLEARVYVRTPPASDGEEPGLVILTSPPLEIRVRDIDPTWLQALARERGLRLLRPDDVRLEASSVYRGLDPESLGTHLEAAPERAVDGDPKTYWLAVPSDDEPSLWIQPVPAVEADTVLLNHARLASAPAGFFARALEVELTINRTMRHSVRLGPGERGPTRFELPELTKVKSLQVRVVSAAPGSGVDAVGFAEVQLQRRGE